MVSSNQHLLVFTAIGPHSHSMLQETLRSSTQCGCNIIRSQYTHLGQESVLTLLLSGTWSAIAKMESLVPQIEQKGHFKALVKRTTYPETFKRALPYTIDITAADRPGILQEINEFFKSQHLSIQELKVETSPATRQHSSVLTINISVDIPEKVHLAGLREHFMIYCEDRNLDAVLEPQKLS